MSGRLVSIARAMRAINSSGSFFSWILPLGDSPDVQQIVEQSRHVLYLAREHAVHLLVCGVGTIAPTQDLCDIADRREGFLNSWPSIARNSSLCRSASASCAYLR